MSERSDLLESIVDTIKDYRADEIAEPTAKHVDRWINQFSEDAQVGLLREVHHVFNETYLARDWMLRFLGRLVKNKKLAGEDACDFWAKAHFLQIQQRGLSQEEMLALFDESLEEECGIASAKCGKTGGDYVYIDDVMFSGSRVGNDLDTWITNEAPARATIHVIVAALHTLGHYLTKRRLAGVIVAAKKNIEVRYWRAKDVENRKSYKNDSEVLWPAVLPDDKDVKKYLERPQKFPFEPRKAGGKLGPFSSEEGRQLLEREMLIAGVHIRGLSKNPADILRPLGFSPFGLGFGSMIATFRNCPNNCPLALWWGDPEATSGPFHWYPLLPRKTYGQ